MKRSFLLWIIPSFLFLLYLPFSTSLDFLFANFFYTEGRGFLPPPWSWKMYSVSLIPGFMLFIASTLLVLFYLFKEKPVWWKSALYVSLVLVVGSGIITNGIIKEFWHRPRPKQCKEFHGKFPYQPLFYSLRDPEKNLRSLPSGHATMGFYFLSLFFVGRRLKNRGLQRFGFLTACLLGSLISWVRMMQGGHFLSDILVSFIIMWMSSYFLDKLLYRTSYD